VTRLSYELKFERATKHIETLRKTCKTWLGSNAYRIVIETEPETGYTVHRVKIRKPVPPTIALIVGDAAHNLRSTLDQRALELAVSYHGAQPVPVDIEADSEFPIFPYATSRGALGSDLFSKLDKKGHPVHGSGVHKLRGINPDAIRDIEGKQPYHRGPTDFATDPLWVIHELDRIDKRRRVNVTEWTAAGLKMGIQSAEHIHIRRMGHTGPIEDGTELAAFKATNAQFKVDATREIAFAQGGPAQNDSVVSALEALRDYISGTIFPLLTPYL